MVSLFQSRPLYREFSVQRAGFEGDTVMFVLGAESFLLAAGGLLLVGAGIGASGFRSSPLSGHAFGPVNRRTYS